MVFDPKRIKAKIRDKAKKAMSLALQDGIVDLNIRLDSGQSTTGRRFSYSKQTAKRKGKSAPVDFTDTGILRGAIDYEVQDKDRLIGMIGIRDVGRGKTSNLEILKNLIAKFPNMWGMTKKHKENLINSFVSNFRG